MQPRIPPGAVISTWAVLKARLPYRAAALAPSAETPPAIGNWHFGAHRLFSILNSEIDT